MSLISHDHMLLVYEQPEVTPETRFKVLLVFFVLFLF